MGSGASMSARAWMASIIGAERMAEIELEATVEISLSPSGRTIWRGDCAQCRSQGQVSPGPEHECGTPGHASHCTNDSCF